MTKASVIVAIRTKRISSENSHTKFNFFYSEIIHKYEINFRLLFRYVQDVPFYAKMIND